MKTVSPSSIRKRRFLFPIIVRWTALALTGWLAYGLLRGLWVTIVLGAPVYDWSWYPPVIALLLGLLLWLAWGRPYHRYALLVFASLLGLIAVGYNGFGQSVYLYPTHQAPIPISFWTLPATDFRQTPDTLLKDLKAAGGYVYWSPGLASLEGERRLALVAGLHKLASHDIEVYLMPPSGNFLSTPVHYTWITSAHNFVDLVYRHQLSNVRGLIGDVEPPMGMPLDITGADQAAFAQAASNLGELIDTMHREHPNQRLGVTATWMHYADGLDGDADLSVIMRSSVDPPGGWDFINVMAYSSFFPLNWRAYYLYLSERAMARYSVSGCSNASEPCYLFNQVSYLIGMVGSGQPPRLLDFDDLVRDAQLSRAMGVSEIVVYNLHGARKVFGDDFVRQLTVAVNDLPPDITLRVPFSRPISLMFYAIAAGDALLDIRGRWKAAWIGWAILSGLIAYRSVAGAPLGATHQ